MHAPHLSLIWHKASKSCCSQTILCGGRSTEAAWTMHSEAMAHLQPYQPLWTAACEA